MLNFGNKEFRNLQEQVQKNKDDLLDVVKGTASFGIVFKGTAASTAEVEDPQVNDFWLIGDPTMGFYVYQFTDEGWRPLGPFGQGPEGEQGPVGPKGDKGDKGDPATNIITSVNNKTGDVVLTASDIKATNAQSVQTNLERIDSEINRVEAEIPDVSDLATKDELQDEVIEINAALHTESETRIYEHGELQSQINNKQNTLTAGENITIENNVISATGGGSADNMVTTDTAQDITGTKTFKSSLPQFGNAFEVSYGQPWVKNSSLTGSWYVDYKSERLDSSNYGYKLAVVPYNMPYGGMYAIDINNIDFITRTDNSRVIRPSRYPNDRILDIGDNIAPIRTITATNLSDGTTTKTMTEVLAGGGGDEPVLVAYGQDDVVSILEEAYNAHKRVLCRYSNQTTANHGIVLELTSVKLGSDTKPVEYSFSSVNKSDYNNTVYIYTVKCSIIGGITPEWTAYDGRAGIVSGTKDTTTGNWTSLTIGNETRSLTNGTAETWEFTLEDGSTITKNVLIG